MWQIFGNPGTTLTKNIQLQSCVEIVEKWYTFQQMQQHPDMWRKMSNSKKTAICNMVVSTIWNYKIQDKQTSVLFAVLFIILNSAHKDIPGFAVMEALT